MVWCMHMSKPRALNEPKLYPEQSILSIGEISATIGTIAS